MEYEICLSGLKNMAHKEIFLSDRANVHEMGWVSN